MEIIKIMELLKNMVVENLVYKSSLVLEKNDEVIKSIEHFDWGIEGDSIVLEDVKLLEKIKVKITDIKMKIQELIFKIDNDEYKLSYM